MSKATIAYHFMRGIGGTSWNIHELTDEYGHLGTDWVTCLLMPLVDGLSLQWDCLESRIIATI